MEHPYKEFENLPLWVTIDNAVDDLEENTTAREYVIGYLCKGVIESDSIAEKSNYRLPKIDSSE